MSVDQFGQSVCEHHTRMPYDVPFTVASAGKGYVSVSYSDAYTNDFAGKLKCGVEVFFGGVWARAGSKAADPQVQRLWRAVVQVCNRFSAHDGDSSEAAFVRALVGGVCGAGWDALIARVALLTLPQFL